MSSFIPIKGKTGECDPHRPPVPEAYYTKRETDALLATKVSFDQFNNHILNTTVHITAEERAAWNNKITEPAEEGSAGDVLVTDGEGGRTWSASPTHTATWGQITGTLSNQTDLHTRLTTDETNISNEVTRATSAEGLLGQRITTETTRATNAESVLTSSIAAEVTRATNAETTLTTNLSNEVTRATSAEATKVDKTAINDAGIKNITWATTVEGTFTTVEDPYKAQRPTGTNTRYWGETAWTGGRPFWEQLFRVTVNDTVYDNLCADYGIILDTGTTSSTSYSLLGNKHLYDSRYYDTGELFCLIYIEHDSTIILPTSPYYYSDVVGNVIIFTSSATSISFKVERATINYKELPKPFQSNFGYEDSEYVKYANDSSYVGRSIGMGNILSRNCYAIGQNNCVQGFGTVALGSKNEVSGGYAIGSQNIAAAYGSAIGSLNAGVGTYSAAIGGGNVSFGSHSLATGWDTRAFGAGSHSAGVDSVTRGDWSIAQGCAAVTTRNSQTVLGNYNAYDNSQIGTAAVNIFECVADGVSDTYSIDTNQCVVTQYGPGYVYIDGRRDSSYISTRTDNSYKFNKIPPAKSIIYLQFRGFGGSNKGKYLFTVGNGKSNATRSNAHTLDWEGNAEFQGDVKANACGGATPISLVGVNTALGNEVTRATGVEATKENVSNKVTEILSTSTHTEYASAKSVYDAISAIPKALVYKGTIGVGGTIQVLPEATEDRGGWTYKVITEAIYPPMTEKASIGDLIVCAWEEEPQPEGTYKWTLIPAGAEKVKDVQINGTSILSDSGIANIPIAGNDLGVVKTSQTEGVYTAAGGTLALVPPTNAQIDSRYTAQRRGIFVENLDYAVKAALTDGVGPAYTTEQKTAAQNRLGVTEAIATETTRATTAETTLDTNKMDKTNPTGTGSLSINRKAGTEVGGSSFTAGSNCEANNSCSFAHGETTKASGRDSHSEGFNTVASGHYSHAEGGNSVASGSASHAEGNATKAVAFASHSIGLQTEAKGIGSLAEGSGTITYGAYSHAEGWDTRALGNASHAEGSDTIASGHYSHAEGMCSKSLGRLSNAQGYTTVATRQFQSVSGKFNTPENTNLGDASSQFYYWIADGSSASFSLNDSEVTATSLNKIDVIPPGTNAVDTTYTYTVSEHTWTLNKVPPAKSVVVGYFTGWGGSSESKYAHIVGNGTADNARSNAHTLDWNGNAEFAGDVIANGCGGTNPISLVGVKEDVKRLDNYIDGNLNGKTTNTEVANIKNLPTNVYSTTVNDIGGNSIVWNQLLNPSFTGSLPRVHNGVTWSAGSVPGTYTYSGTLTSIYSSLYFVRSTNIDKVITLNHKYISHRATPQGMTFTTHEESGFWKLFTVTAFGDNSGIYSAVTGTSGQEVSGSVIPMVFDLTLMFGAGNEPSTVAEFEAMFPNAYYPYSVPTVTHAAVDKVIYRGKNLSPINNITGTLGNGAECVNNVLTQAYSGIVYESGQQYVLSFDYTSNAPTTTGLVSTFYYTDGTEQPLYLQGDQHVNRVSTAGKTLSLVTWSYGIGGKTVTASNLQLEKATAATTYEPYYHTEVNVPTAVQQLEGYGWGIGNYYNEVNYSTKKYIKRVGTYTFTGNETDWQIYNPSTYIHNDGFDVAFVGLTFVTSSNEILCKSNYFVGYPAVDGIWSGEGKTWRMCCNTTNQMHFNIPHSETGTSSTSTIDECKAAFKTWLQAKATAGNPLTVYYVLATSTETDITSLLTNTDIIKDTVTKNHITAQFNNTLQLPMYNSITNTSKKSVVNDVTINNTSIVTDGVANIPFATNGANGAGVTRYSDEAYGIGTTNGYAVINRATTSEINERSHRFKSIVPYNLVTAVDSVLCSTSASEALTSEQKAAARTRIGAQKSKFFDVTYGTTTYDEITAAIEAGLTPICTYDYNGYIGGTYTFFGYNNSYAIFSKTYSNVNYYIRVTPANTWIFSNTQVENSYNLRLNSRRKAGASGLPKYMLCAEDIDGRLTPIALGDTTSATKTACTVPFRPENLWYFANSASLPAGQDTANYLYEAIYTTYCTYMFNSNVPAYNTIYLVGSYDKTTGLFTLDSTSTTSYYVCVPNDTASITLSDYFTTGKYYIKIGATTNAQNNMQITLTKPMYYFNGTSLVDGKEDFHVMDATTFESLPVKSGYYFVY